MEKEKLLFMNEGLNSTEPTWSSCNFSSKQLTKNCYLNPKWDHSMDQSDRFESALSSAVSSPAASNATTTTRVIIPPGVGDDDNNNNNNNVVMIGELIGRLGNIRNSGEISPPKLNLSMISSSCSNLLIPAADTGFSDRAARLSCFAAADSKEDPSLSEQITSQTVTGSNPRKRKSIPRSKVKETPSTNDPKVVAENNEESYSKRNKQDESDSSKAKDNSKAVEPPNDDYIHVRARRGSATDSHSLAERVRREKISERMKFLQDLVPGCNKVTGKAVMLDEIINYVQSLQRQVEFLSMKLATVNPRMDLNMEALLSKDMFQSQGSLLHSLYPVDCSAQASPFGYQPQQGLHLTGGITSNAENQFSINPLNAALLRNHIIQMPPINGCYGEAGRLVPSLWEDDLQSLVQMGFNQNQQQSLNGSMATTQDGN